MKTSKYVEGGRFEWLETQESREWDDFVIQEGGSIFHLWAWRKVLENENSKPLYLVCRDSGGRILAACPFFQRSGRRLKYLDSLPDSYTAGPIISGLAPNPSQIIESLPKSVRFTLSNPVVAMHIKAHRPEVVGPMLALGFRHVTHGLFILDLGERSPEHIWTNGFKKHDRQAVKFYESHASFGFTKNDNDYRGLSRPDWRNYHFYSLRLAEPGFISKMREKLGDRFRVAVANDSNGVALAGFLMLIDPQNSTGQMVHLLAIKHAPTRNIHSAVTFVNWKAVTWAHEHGFRYVNFGSYTMKGLSDPAHKFFKLRTRFEITPQPRYEFALPTSNVSHWIAKKISRIL